MSGDIDGDRMGYIYIYICFLYFSKIGLQQMVVWNQHTWDFMNSDGDTNEI